MNLVDSCGWLDYLTDSHRADFFATAIEQRDQLLVPTIALFEVHSVLSRRLAGDIVDRCMSVMRLGRVLDLTDARAVAASIVSKNHGLTLAHAAMYSMALEWGAQFWTHNLEYQSLPQVQCFSISKQYQNNMKPTSNAA